MNKVQIQTKCWYCKGKAMMLVDELGFHTTDPTSRYLPCPYCHGSGDQEKWITLLEFIAMLNDPMSECPHNHSSMNGYIHFSGGEVWDDITEECNDCGAILDKLRPLGGFIDEVDQIP